LLDETQVGAILRGARGSQPVDLEQFERLILRFSQVVVEQTGIKEIDLNPVVCSKGQLHILDARILLHAKGSHSPALPSGPLVPLEAKPARVGAPSRPTRLTPRAGRKGIDARTSVLASGSAQRRRSHEAKGGA
jgi:hypothetical protein